MAADPWFSLFASVGHLTLALLAVSRRTRSPVALPLALLCLDMFAWNFATWAFQISGEPTWHWLDVTFSPFTPPLALHLILAFVGRARKWRWVLVIAYLAYALLSMSSAMAFFFAWARSWADSGGWAIAFLAGWIPIMLVALALLVTHGRNAANAKEKARTRLVIAALAIGGTLGSTELWDNLMALPDLGDLGTLAATGLLTIVVLRFRLFGHDLSASAAVYALALALLAVGGYLAVFQLFATNTATLLLGTITVTLGLLIASRQLVASMAVRRERRRQLEGLGRFAAQMAHDLKNPLAAMKGALQYLAEEKARGGTLDEDDEFLELLGRQVDRIGEVIGQYRRLGRVEPLFEAVELNEVVREVLALQPFAAGEAISVDAELAEGLPACQADRDMIAGALESLVANGVEAMPSGGILTVRTSRAPGGVMVTVVDEGEGMDARHRERAFDSFYTTKAEGTGLGLAHARRIIEAHGGEIFLSSQRGQGTIAGFTLRAGPEPEGSPP
jgi:signal transduction histidine kinase